MFDEQALELMRQDLQKRYLTTYITVGVLAFILGSLLSPFLGIFICLFALAAVAIFTQGWKKPYLNAFKESVIGSVFHEQFENVRIDFETGFSEEALEAVGLIQTGNRFHSDDYVSGVCDGVPFQRSDVYIAQVTTDSKGHSSTTVYFEGRWMMFQFPKQIAGDLQIIQKGFHYANSKNGIFTRKSSRRHKIEMEDTDFNRAFSVLAQVDQDAFYFLTPHRMEEVSTYCQSIQGDVMIGIIGNVLHVAVNTRKNAMEPSVMKKPNMVLARAECEYEASLIRKTVKFFDLDQETFQGE